MKTSNVEGHGTKAADATRGRRSGLLAGAKGMIWRDPVTESVGQIRDMTVQGATLIDNEDGTGVLIIGSRSGSGGGTGGGGGVLPNVNAPIVAALSNPPTQAELETAIGLAASEVPAQSYVVTDSDTGLTYGVVSDGFAFQFVPIVQTSGNLATLASAAGVFSDFSAMWGAAQYDATSNKTFWAYLNAAGDVQVRSWNHATQTASAATTLHSALDPGDSHGQPAVLIRSSDRKVFVFYSAHNGANMYYRLSSAAADISAFGVETDIDAAVGGTAYTYGIAHELTDGIYLFVRTVTGGVVHAGAKWSYTKSTDNGATWGAKVEVITDAVHGMYWIPSKTAADRVDFSVCDFSPFDEAGGSIYHMSMVGGAFYTTDGTAITATKPFDESAMTLVWQSDGTQRGDPGQVQLGPDGLPCMVFREFEDISPEDCRYMFARWDGSDWFSVEVDAAGSGSQTATTVFADGDPFSIYYSKDDGSSVAQIYHATTFDGGATWSGVPLTDSANDNANLITIRGAPADMKVIWAAKSGGWTRNDTVAADFYGAAFEPIVNADAQRIVVISGTGLDEAIIQRTAGGVWQISRDLGSSWESLGGTAALDDLSDVTISAPAVDDTLRWNGSAWVNDNRRWEPVTSNPGTGPEMVFDGDDIVMNWAPY